MLGVLRSKHPELATRYEQMVAEVEARSKLVDAMVRAGVLASGLCCPDRARVDGRVARCSFACVFGLFWRWWP